MLSASAYTEKNIQEGLREKLGFDSYEPEEYHPKNDYEGDYDQVGYSIETKTTGNGVPIIAIVVRGTPGNGEWLSNLNIDDTGKGFGQDTHEGFNKAAEKVTEAFAAYVKDNRIDLDHARVLVTGHSRGASVANLIGARLDKGEGVDYSDGEVTGKLSADRIYTYTFESPEVTTSSDCDNSRYDNIYNIVNPEDVITRVPLSEATWGYNRYGKDLVLPSKSNCSDDAYKALREKMGGYFYQFAGTSYANYKTGALMAKAYSAEVLALAPFTYLFYSSKLPSLVSPRQFFDSIVRTVIMKEPSLFDTMIIAGALSVKPYQLITRTLLGTVAVSSKAELADRVVHGHTQEMYVAWMKSAADAAPALGELPSIFTHSSYRTFSAACPVDVKAYDSEGNLVASIVDDQVDESLLENGIPAEVTSGGTKMVDLPADGEYRLEVSATADGEMDVTIEENDGTGGDPLNVKCYQGISLDAGDSFTMEAPATSAPDDCTLVDGASGEEAQAGSIVSGSNLEKATVSVVAEGSGYAWGGGSVIKGGKMYVHAKASDLSTFVGWRCSSGSGGSDEIVSTDQDFEVRATGDMTCTAVFNTVPAKASERLSGETRYDTMAAISSTGFTCADSVVLASGKNFPDALGASALGGSLNAPVLLTDPNALSDQAASEIERLGARTVYIVGGTAAVSSGVETDLRSKGYKVERIFSNSRQQTAVEIAKTVAGMASPDTAIVAAGETAWDSLSVSPFAYAKGYPVYLAEKDGSVSQETVDAIKASSSIKRIIIVGGNAAVSTKAESTLMGVVGDVERWYGDSRYETSKVIAERATDEGMSPITVAVASGENFPDALAGGALVGGRGGVLLLSPSGDGSQAAQWLEDRTGEVGECYLLGGTAALSDDVQRQIDAALG